MLEERFGRFWANLLLLLAVLGAAAWGINTFFVDFVVPGANLLVLAYGKISGVHIAIPERFDAVLGWVRWGLEASLFVAVPVLPFLSTRLSRRLERVERSLGEDLAAHCQTIAMFQKREALHLQTIKSLEAKNAELKEASAKLLTFVEVKDRAPDGD